nr:hypothetical protein [Streptomyces hainanensis]
MGHWPADGRRHLWTSDGDRGRGRKPSLQFIRFAAAPRSSKGRDELSRETLVIGILVNQLAQLGGGPGITAGGQRRIDPQGMGRCALFFETPPQRVHGRSRVGGDPGQRGTSPQRQRRVEQCVSLFVVALGEQRTGLLEPCREPVAVQVFPYDVEHVAAGITRDEGVPIAVASNPAHPLAEGVHVVLEQ